MMLRVDYIQNLVDALVRRYEEINLQVIGDIARRVAEIGALLPSDVQRLTALVKYGGDIEQINREIARRLLMPEREIKEIIREAAEGAYADAKPFYDYRAIDYVPFGENMAVQNIVSAIRNETWGTFRNMSGSTATGFVMRDLAAPGTMRVLSLKDTYVSVIDEAINAVKTETIDYQTAMRRTMQQLVDSGFRRVEYSPVSGRRYTQRLDTAVRRNILDGIRAINQGVRDETGRQFGADGVELTAHPNPAADHQYVQGHQFTMEEFKKMQMGESCHDYQGRKYEGFERNIGMWNCRHVAYSVVLESAVQSHSDSELQAILDRNEAGYTTSNGKHMTMYECTQYQRKLETKIRYAKEGVFVAEKLNDDIMKQKYMSRAKSYYETYKTFSRACGLKMQPDRFALPVGN